MSLKSAKKLLGRLGKKKDKTRNGSRGRAETNAPVTERTPDPAPAPRPQIGGHRAEARAVRQPMIGGHRGPRATVDVPNTPEGGAPQTAPGFVRGEASGGQRGGGMIGAHRAWSRGMTGGGARGGLTIGGNRAQTSKVVQRPTEKKAPVDDTLGPKTPVEDTPAPDAKSVQDVPETSGPKSVKEPQIEAPIEQAPEPTPIESNGAAETSAQNPRGFMVAETRGRLGGNYDLLGGGLDNYGTGGGLDNYGTGNGLDNYGTGNGLDNYGTGNALDNYGRKTTEDGSALDNYGQKAGQDGSALDNYGQNANAPSAISGDAVASGNYGENVVGNYGDQSGVALISSSGADMISSSESVKKDSKTLGPLERGRLIDQVRAAKAARARKEKEKRAQAKAEAEAKAAAAEQTPPTSDAGGDVATEVAENTNDTSIDDVIANPETSGGAPDTNALSTNDNATSGGNYATSNYATSNAPLSNYGNANKIKSNYGQSNDSTEMVSDSGISLISESESESESISIRTAKMSARTSELIRFKKTGKLDPYIEVQDAYEGSENPEVAEMHRSLRGGLKNLYDVPENVMNLKTKTIVGQNQIRREAMTSNESKSAGWALLSIRTNHRESDLGKEDKPAVPWDVQYAISESTKLEQDVIDYIGSHLTLKREDYLCHMVGGKLVDYEKKDVDTLKADGGGQAQRQRLEKLNERLEKARESGLAEQVEKLEKKIDIAHTTPELDKHIAGKFIYVMNAGGQFFATKPEQFKIHHSTMLASGAVACAGEIRVTGGVIQSISNMSGHYRPGPVFLWQAVKQLEMMGAPMDFAVDVVGVSRKFKTAREFLGAMDPVADPQLFNGAYAAAWLEGRSL